MAVVVCGRLLQESPRQWNDHVARPQRLKGGGEPALLGGAHVLAVQAHIALWLHPLTALVAAIVGRAVDDMVLAYEGKVGERPPTPPIYKPALAVLLPAKDHVGRLQ